MILVAGGTACLACPFTVASGISPVNVRAIVYDHAGGKACAADPSAGAAADIQNVDPEAIVFAAIN